jgi:putative hydrolase of HD superfamily
MEQREFIDFLNLIEKLKCNMRHSWTSTGRRESVAEHSWRLAVMAMICGNEYPDLDINKVIKMCLVHDFGEAITGDIPAFLKTDQHEKAEDVAVNTILSTLPEAERNEISALFDEMRERATPEAKLFKALDNMEALISHNEADISTWLPREYEDNIVYGKENASWSEWTKELHKEITKDTIKKIGE